MEDEYKALIEEAKQQSQSNASKGKEEPKKEEQKVEAKKEEKKEEIKSNTAFIDKLKAQGINVNSEEDVEKIILDLNSKVATYNSKEGDIVKQIEELNRYKEIAEGYDPLQHFSSVESYKGEQLKKQFPNLSRDVADKVISADLSTLTLEDKVSIALRIKHPDLTDGEIKSLIVDKYGEDEDRSDAKKAQLKVDASDSVNEILKLRSSVKDPEKIDLKSVREKRDKDLGEATIKIEQDWMRESDKALFDKFVVTDKVDGKDELLISLDVEDEFRKEIKKDIVEYFKSNRIPVTEESLAFAKQEALEIYRRKNYVKTLKLFAKQEVEKAREQWEKENAGMGGHVSRKADGKKDQNNLTEADVQRMVNGTSDNGSIKMLKY